MEKNGDIIEYMLKMIKLNGRQSKYLEFLEIIQNVNGEYLLVNQKIVLNLLFDQKYKQHILYMKEAGNKKYAFE